MSALGSPEELATFRKALAVVRSKVKGGGTADPCAPFASYRADPVGFVRDVLGETSWAGQDAIMRAVYEHRRVTIRSAHKTGKSYSFGWLATQFMSTAPSIVIAVSPVEDQNKDGIFAHVRRIHAETRARGVRLPGEPNMLSWEIAPKHYMTSLVARSLHATHGRHAGVRVPEGDPNRDLTDEEMAAFLEDVESGAFGETRVLLIFDEAAAIPQHIFDGFRGTMASPLCYAVMAANPVCDYNAEHEYSRSHHPGSGWHRIKIAALSDDGDPVSADETFDRGFGKDGLRGVPNWLLPEDYPESMARECGGTDTPMYLGKVLAQFSRALAENVVIPWTVLQGALEREGSPGLGPRIGVDVADTGDRCAMVLYMDGVKCGEKTWRNPESDQEALMTVAATVSAQARAWGAALKAKGFDWDGSPIPGARISVDATGIGSAVCARLAQLGIHTDRVNFGSAPAGHYRSLWGDLRFANERARMHWVTRRLLQEGRVVIPERYATSWREASWAQFELRPVARGTEFHVEPKKDIVKRHGQSPDVWDADMLAIAREPGAGPRIVGIGGTKRAKVRRRRLA